ncbi:MAG: AbiV family abortive infection protein [Nitrososphaerota archaeon]|nr:AbiV family abortive infection protein [Nitrososphaerota archaeon]
MIEGEPPHNYRIRDDRPTNNPRCGHKRSLPWEKREETILAEGSSLSKLCRNINLPHAVQSISTEVMNRETYRKVALAALQNARELLSDAERLRRAGHRGHSCSLAVLSIEESAKSFLYSLAGVGLSRVTKRRTNGPTDFFEKDVLDHKVKHMVFARLIADRLLYGPFYAVTAGIRTRKMSKEEVENRILIATFEHRRLQLELQPGQPANARVVRLFQLINSLNTFKNRGLYVSRNGYKVEHPNDISRDHLDEVIDLANEALEVAGGLTTQSIPRSRLSLIRELAQELSKAKEATDRRTASTITSPQSLVDSGQAK